MNQANQDSTETSGPPHGVARRNAWLQMLRPPNLFTVPGDPLAGWLLASACAAEMDIGVGAPREVAVWQVVLAASASLLIYAGGLIQNDYYDLDEDRRQRPWRPLPSGRVKPGVAMTVAMLLMAAGVAAAWIASAVSGVLAAVTLGFVTAYNAGGKRAPVVGPILMGVCRGLSLLIGAGVLCAPHPLGVLPLLAPPVLLSAVGLTLLIAAITRIAARETQAGAVGQWRRVPGLIALAWMGGLLLVLPPSGKPEAYYCMIGISVWTVVWMMYCGNLLREEVSPGVVQSTIGMFIGGLLFAQAAMAMHKMPEGGFVATGLLLAWVVSRRVAKWFYAS